MQTNAISNAQLRNFGFILAGGLFFLFGVIPLLREKSLNYLPLIIALGILTISLVKASLLNVIYHPWMKIGHVLGWINTRIILGIIYFVIITPIGLVMKIFGKDAMARKFDANAKTYRLQSQQPQPQDMERPF